MSPAWTAEQRRCLDALGFTLYRTTSANDADAMQVTPGDPLLIALQRAAGRDLAQAHAEAWLRGLGIASLEQLRADPSAKRALWPRLRSLRRDRSRS